MKTSRLLLVLFFAITLPASAQNGKAQSQPPQPPPTISSVVDREVTVVEKLLLDVAEAMPEEKFNFTPENLNLPGADYKGVRGFAAQLKHVAASNYLIWSPVIGAEAPKDANDGKGPDNLKSKAEIIQYLKESFALGHKVAASLTTANMLDPIGQRKSARLRLASFAVEHAFDHYGHLGEYLRMNGIIPPASRN